MPELESKLITGLMQQASLLQQPGMMQPGMMQPGLMQPGLMQPCLFQSGAQLHPGFFARGGVWQPADFGGAEQGAGMCNM